MANFRRSLTVVTATSLAFGGVTGVADFSPELQRLVVPAAAAQTANDATGASVTPGAVGSAVVPIHQVDMKQTTLALVKKWRQDALNTNVQWPNMNSTTTVRDYLNQKGISEAEYLNPKWSYELERTALQRAAEILDTSLGHNRPNGQSWSTVSFNGVNPQAEVLAWGQPTIAAAIDGDMAKAGPQGWADEKPDWVNKNAGAMTIHYEVLINPDFKYYGFAGAYSGTKPRWVGHASRTGSNEAATSFSGDYTFNLPLKQENLNKLTVPTTYEVGTPVTLNLSQDIPGDKFSPATTVTYAATITDSNGLFRIEGNKLTPTKPGTTTLTITSGSLTRQVTVTVTGEAAPATVTNVAQIPPVSTEAKVAPELPQTVAVTWSDGKVTQEPIVWAITEADYATRTTTPKTITGTILDGSREVTTELTVTSKITQVANPQGVTTPSGTDPAAQLPAEVQVTYSDGQTAMAKVTWPASTREQYAKREGGTYQLAGTVEGTTLKSIIDVTVTPATVTGVEQPTPVTVTQNTQAVLPQTVNVTYSNGETVPAPVAWSAVDTSAVGTQTATATVEGQPVSLTVEVVEATATEVPALEPVAVASGETAALPATVPATFSDGTTRDVAVTWEPLDDAAKAILASRAGGEFQVKGKVEGVDEPVLVTVTVAPAAAEQATLADPTVETASGTEPQLPKTATVTWSNGETSEEPITWNPLNKDEYSQRSGATFEVEGTVADKLVKATVTVAPATFTTVEPAAASVTTQIGQMPTLPQVLAVWSNGDEDTVAVTWEEVDPALLEAEGEFPVNGTAEYDGQTYPLSVTVKVGAQPEEESPEVPESLRGNWLGAIAAFLFGFFGIQALGNWFGGLPGLSASTSSTGSVGFNPFGWVPPLVDWVQSLFR